MQLKCTPEGQPSRKISRRDMLATLTLAAVAGEVAQASEGSGTRPKTSASILASVTDPATLREIDKMEQRLDEATVNYAEGELLNWLQHGTIPQHISTTDNVYILDSLDPDYGGSTIDDINLDARAWWLSVRALQERLRTFVELEIPEPRQITPALVERLQREEAAAVKRMKAGKK